jgi:hypothetical protein
MDGGVHAAEKRLASEKKKAVWRNIPPRPSHIPPSIKLAPLAASYLVLVGLKVGMTRVACGGGGVAEMGEFDPIEADGKMGLTTANLTMVAA